MSTDRSVSIYVLLDPRDSSPRYVGRTVNLNSRLRAHINSKENTHKGAWIRKLSNFNMVPTIEVLEEVTETTWIEAEIFWIAYLKSLGANLTNSTLGGDYDPVHMGKLAEQKIGTKLSEETKKKISQGNLGKTQTEATKQKISQAQVGKVMSEEAKQKISQSKENYKPEQEHLEKLWAGRLEYQFTSEHREAISMAQTGKVLSTEHREAISRAQLGKVVSEETKNKTSLALKGRAKSEESIRKAVETRRRNKTARLQEGSL